MPNLTPTVFVVHPDASARVSLEALIRAEGWTAEGFASAGAFLARRSLRQPSCVLVALDLPDLAGLDVVRRMVADRAETPVIVLSGQLDISWAVRAVKAGAVEVLAKRPSDEALLAAAEDALALSRAVLEHQAEIGELRARYHSLTHRERQVMARVVAGHLNKQIAASLAISEITVKAHRGRVMRKMGATSLAELVTVALRLVLPPTGAATPSVSSRALLDSITRLAQGTAGRASSARQRSGAPSPPRIVDGICAALQP